MAVRAGPGGIAAWGAAWVALLTEAVRRFEAGGSSVDCPLDCSELEVFSWPQTWESTSCGSGAGGAAITTAQTVVVMAPGRAREVHVYHAWRFAYTVRRPTPLFWQRCAAHHLPGACELRPGIDEGEG